ncbi:TPA: LPS export ABC transporter periplasmic protein LptC [Candidatus Dependentiae bacterium]|nr:MAG: hypothetical protein UR14_C0003G0120 [candidate division TM6 bacterium GW2011_GWE2_31_21]KKP53716.1 MAG: hypothetical protein UR43_C0003G0037 [candidate division TM6 bacterium GW2011_GWF2_33_332]HBS48532.1 LPS export ABC transporter periplasmic protein LptC [Candidatus Dependentiae bacterium]HBZ73147.1 LPS export ABC transporter periplasmic protein LptC [Candidatus Dependentiae bacterium]
MKKYIIFLPVFILLIFAFVKYRSINKSNEIIQNKQQEVNEVVVTAKDISLKELNPQSLKGWQINSKSAQFYKNQNEIVCKSVACNLLTKDDQAAFLNSDKTVINSKTKDIFMQGNINGSFNGISLLGETFSYKFDKHIISSKSDVTLNHSNFQLKSKETFIDLKNKKIVLSGKVETSFSMLGKQR